MNNPSGEQSEKTITEGAAELSAPLADESSGGLIGRYKLLEKLGEGGFGAVWMAEQTEPVKRRVALKILKLGMDTRQVVARFEAERQALALMDHPNIAKVLDAGATESGRPFFVMELVRGIPVTTYCDQHQLSTDERLQLFATVCQAIQHAHQKGIIHRDIKPSNILVTMHDGVPVPKVIDFGIAKATQQDLTDKTLFTQIHQFIGTPAYMSPEQAEMSGLDIDTRSDVYSLGVLLYELLTGRTPFDSKQLLSAGVDEMRRIIRDKEALRPSTRLSQMLGDELTTTARSRQSDPPKLIHLLRGDLDWIVMKCLEKDRTHRYETANAVAMDVKRFLHHEPVLARPPSQTYRLQKLIRRNKVAASATLAVAAALVIGLVVSSWMFLRERDARQRAVLAERDQAQQRAAADAARERAERGEQAAARSAEAARLNLYVASLNIAEQALRENDLRRAVEHLDALTPKFGEKDLRGFEWYYLRDQCRTHDLFSIREPSGMVEAMDLSPDGRYVAAANMDASVKVWDLQSRTLKLHLTNSATRLFAVAYSPDGKKVAAASRDLPRVFVWEARTGELLISPSDVPGAIMPIAFSRDSSLLITGLNRSPRGFQLWRLADKQPLGTFTDDDQPAIGIVADRNRDRFVAAYASGNLQFWEGNPPRSVTTVRAHSAVTGFGQFFGIALSADGNLLATGGHDESLQLWDVANRRRIFELSQGGGPVWTVGFSSDGTRLVSGHADSSLQVWDTASGKRIGTLRGHQNEVFGVKFVRNSSRLVSCSKDHTLRMWDLKSLTTPEVLSLEARPQIMQFSPTSGQIAFGFVGKSVRVWSTRELIEEFQLPHRSTLRPRWPVGTCGTHRIAVITSSRTVEIWDAFTSQLLREFSNSAQVATLAMSHDEQWLARLTPGGDTEIHDLNSGALVGKHRLALSSTVRNAVLLKSAHQLAVSHEPTFVTIWDLKNDSSVASLLGHYDHVSAMLVTPDEKQLVTSTMDGAVKVWQTSDWSLLHDLHGHTAIIWDLAISPDGRTLASAGADRKIRLWNTHTWRLTQTLEGHETPVMRVVFSPNGEYLASASDVGEVRFWRAPRDQQ